MTSAFFIFLSLFSTNVFVTSFISTPVSHYNSLYHPHHLSSLVKSSNLYNSQTLLNLASTSVAVEQVGIQIKIAKPEDIYPCAVFLSTAMYSEPVPRGQQQELVRLEMADLRKRYVGGSSAGTSFPSALLIAQEDGEVIGTLGLDFQILENISSQSSSGSVNTRDNKNSNNSNKKKFKKLTQSSFSFLDETNEKIVVVLANLAVRADKRKAGIGRLLMKESEQIVLKWGYKEIYLMVDSENTNAQRLYSKNGYRIFFEDADATCVAVGEYGLKTKECVNQCYKKSLSANSIGGGWRGKNFFTGLLDAFYKR